MENQEYLNVLVVDDTVVYRRIVSDVITDIGGFNLVGTAANGRLALDKIKRLDVDVVMLDIEMPEMDGLATLKVLRRDYPDINVIMVSGANKRSADITVKALAGGALDFIPKPEGSDPQASRDELAGRIRPLLHLLASRVKHRHRKKDDEHGVTRETTVQAGIPIGREAAKPTHIDVIAIGVSTGGPNALSALIPQLEGDIGVPILLVQHMPAIFTKSLAESLDKKSPLSVIEAVDGQAIEPNTVLIAPGGRHMVVRAQAAAGQRNFIVGINDNPPENHCRPSVDTMFRSVAAHYGGNILAVVMTGMGEDGCDGVRKMKRKGCLCLTQGEKSCVVYGMPRAVDVAGLSDQSVTLEDLPSRISGLVRKCEL